MTDTSKSSRPTSQLFTDEGEVLLQIRDLHTSFYTRDGVVKAVDGVSLRCIVAKSWASLANRAAAKA